MGLSQHTRTAIAHALCDPAASDELIRVVEKLSAFADKFPIVEGDPIDPPAPAVVEPAPVVESAPAPDTGLAVAVTAEATVEPAAPVVPEPPAPTEPPAPPVAETPVTEPAAG